MTATPTDREARTSTAKGFAATAHLATFAVESGFDDLPPTVVTRGKAHLLDALGLGLAGAVVPGTRILHDYLAELAVADGGATVVGSDLRLPARFAAFLNGAAMHAHCYDDTTPQHLPDRNGGVHASGAVTATALALAEPAGVGGRDLMAAYHVGVEVSSRLNHAIDNRHYRDGFHATGTINVFGATAAAARLLGLDVATTQHALGIAASQSSGVRENFGTMTNPFHAGHAAEGGVVAAELAGRGFTAAPDALESPRGFFAAAGGGFDPAPLVAIGAPWAFEDPGIWLKPFPSGALTHPAMKVLAALRTEHGLRAEDVARVRIRTNARIHNILLHGHPGDWLEAKFSMQFGAASILVTGRAGLNEFSDDYVQSAAVQQMMDRIDYAPYDDAEPDYTNTTTFVTLELTDGRVLEDRVDYPFGSPHDPMDFAQVADKFRDCARYGQWPTEPTERAIELVADLENLTDVGELARLFARRR